MKRLLSGQLILLLALTTGLLAQGYFGREKPTGPPTVTALTPAQQSSLTNAQNALATAAQNLAAVKQAILKAHGDATPCVSTATTCTRAIVRPDGYIETTTYTQTPRPVPAVMPKPATPVAH